MTLEKRGSQVRFVLFPMIHLGAPDFYAEVARRLSRCDLILTEGVGGRRTSVVTLSYRLAGRIRRFGPLRTTSRRSTTSTNHVQSATTPANTVSAAAVETARYKSKLRASSARVCNPARPAHAWASFLRPLRSQAAYQDGIGTAWSNIR